MIAKANPAAVVQACGVGSDQLLGQGKIEPKDSALSCRKQRRDSGRSKCTRRVCKKASAAEHSEAGECYG